MIRIGFELETDEGVEAPSSGTVVQALSEALPKEYWADHREDSWGVKALFALDDEGRPLASDQRFRAKSMDMLRAELVQERKLTASLDAEIGRMELTVNEHQERIDEVTTSGHDQILALEAVVENLTEKNDNQVKAIQRLQADLIARTQSLDVSQHEWKHRGKQLADMKDDMGDMAANLTHAEKHLTKKQEALNDANQEAQNHAMMIAKIVAAMEGAGYDISGWGNDEELTELEALADAIEDAGKQMYGALDTIRTRR